ncbi:hypothetical protein VST7929_00263 [Vibrio stylophorae]|uniref:Cell envelope opacity-associated protein A n=1 Tax=Vibrio stylophorae TaxID=659351 RepID=A0ABN8DMS9_9VIBR|nr:LysM-like peptidoglycan-binding domain-containing protein [Vibrio stylophorae]CAH0532434.1 hypothetical protein VST7929_00263 [Vibrio stylophorae]
MGQAKRRAPRPTSQKRQIQFQLPRVDWQGHWQRIKQRCQQGVQQCTQRVKPLWYRLPKPHRIAILCILPIVILVSLLPSSPAVPEPKHAKPARQSIAMDPARLEAESAAVPVEDVVPQEAIKPLVQTQWQRYQIQSGDTMAKVFREHNLAETDLYAIAKIEGAQTILGEIQPGQWIRYKQKQNGELDALQIESDKPILFVRLSNGSFARAKD